VRQAIFIFGGDVFFRSSRDPIDLHGGTGVSVLKLLKGRSSAREATAEWPAREADDLAPLVQRCRRGERDALRTLLITLGPAMLQMVRRVLGAGDPDVEDVFQDATIGLVKALPGFRADCSTRHFGCRIATLTALKARRQRRPERELTWVDVDGDDSGNGGEPVPRVDGRDWALAARRRDVLRGLLDELPDAQAEALVLHCVAGLTIDELAATVHAPVETTRSRLRLAKAALRERIALDPSLAELLLEDAP
jgi:RNA polymerase sigma factor (sigma-70 family)